MVQWALTFQIPDLSEYRYKISKKCDNFKTAKLRYDHTDCRKWHFRGMDCQFFFRGSMLPPPSLLSSSSTPGLLHSNFSLLLSDILRRLGPGYFRFCTLSKYSTSSNNRLYKFVVMAFSWYDIDELAYALTICCKKEYLFVVVQSLQTHTHAHVIS